MEKGVLHKKVYEKFVKLGPFSYDSVLKCDNDHPIFRSTAYPDGYIMKKLSVVCGQCKSKAICSQGYYRCKDDGSTCKNDWCLKCGDCSNFDGETWYNEEAKQGSDYFGEHHV